MSDTPSPFSGWHLRNYTTGEVICAPEGSPFATGRDALRWLHDHLLAADQPCDPHVDIEWARWAAVNVDAPDPADPVSIVFPSHAIHAHEYSALVCVPEWHYRVAQLAPYTQYGEKNRRAVREHLLDLSRHCRRGYSVVAYEALVRAEQAAGRVAVQCSHCDHVFSAPVDDHAYTACVGGGYLYPCPLDGGLAKVLDR